MSAGRSDRYSRSWLDSKRVSKDEDACSQEEAPPKTCAVARDVEEREAVAKPVAKPVALAVYAPPVPPSVQSA